MRGKTIGKINKRKISNKTRLYLYKATFSRLNLAGKNDIKSQWPSNGGMGKRLKTAKIRFKRTIKEKSCGTSEVEKTSGIKR